MYPSGFARDATSARIVPAAPGFVVDDDGLAPLPGEFLRDPAGTGVGAGANGTIHVTGRVGPAFLRVRGDRGCGGCSDDDGGREDVTSSCSESWIGAGEGEQRTHSGLDLRVLRGPYAHFVISDWMNDANCAGVPPAISMPAPLIRSLTSGSASALFPLGVQLGDDYLSACRRGENPARTSMLS